MRCDQLCQIAKDQIGDRWDFDVVALPHFRDTGALDALIEDLSGAIVIFLKRAYNVFSEHQLERLGKCAMKLVVDHVDAPTYPLPDYPFDLHLCASIAGTHALRGQLNGPNADASRAPALVETLIHHWDPRIRRQSFETDTHLRLGYFGLSKNTVIPRGDLDIPHYDGSQLSGDFLERMENTNVHYVVRQVNGRNPKLEFKPFTKGFNAAAAGAHMLVNRGVCDAVEHLGYDYPFFIEDAREELILDGIERLQHAIGTGIWRDAFDAIAHTRERSSPEYSARSLDVILNRLLSS